MHEHFVNQLHSQNWPHLYAYKQNWFTIHKKQKAEKEEIFDFWERHEKEHLQTDIGLSSSYK